MMGRIRVEECGRQTLVEISSEPITIGRDPVSRIVIEDRLASRQHGRFFWDEDSLVYEDLSSSNGSMFDGEKVERMVISNGASICIGDAKLTVELAESVGHPEETTQMPVPEAGDAIAEDEPAGPRLCFLRDGKKRWIAARRTIVLGRGQDADAIIEDPRISGKHATLTQQGGHWFMVDLGSGNGVVVEKQKVAKLALHDGVVFRLGTIEFEAIGFGKSVAPPAAEGSLNRPRQVAATGSSGDFSVGRSTRVDVGSQGSQGLFTVAFILLLGVVLYSGYGLLQDLATNPDLAVSEGDRLSGAGNFELAPVGPMTAGQWVLASPGDSLEILSGESAPQGQKWLQAQGAVDQAGVFRVEFSQLLEVGQSQGLRITARLKRSGFDRVGICVRWIDPRADGDLVIAEDFSSLKQATQWSGHAAEFTPPVAGKGGSARVSLVALGSGNGQLSADQVVVRGVELTRPSPATITAGEAEQKIVFSIDETGVGRLIRGRGELISDLRIAIGPPRLMPWGQLLPTRKEQIVIGDDGSLRLGFELQEEGEQVVIQQFARPIGWRIAASWAPQRPVPLLLVGRVSARRLDAPVQVFSGDKSGTSSERLGDLVPCVGTEISVGKGSDQLVISFRSEMQFSLVPDVSGRGGLLIADAGIVVPGDTVDISISASSEREQARVMAAIADVNSSIESRKEGHAFRLAKEARAAFPWRADLGRKLDLIEQRIQIEVDTAMAQIDAVLDDSRRYPGSPTDDYLERICREAIVRFVDLDPAIRSQEILTSREQVATSEQQLLAEGRIDLLLARGRESLGKARFEIARFYFQWVVDHHPETPGAANAQQELKLIDARGN